MPDRIEVTVEKLVYGGHGLSRQQGRVWLTPFVLPGEHITAEPVDRLHARLIRVETPAAQRVAPGCPYYGACGGCHVQHAPYPYQLDQKVGVLREVIRRVGKFEAPDEIQVISGLEWQYRNRVQFHIRGGEIGYLRMGSHELVPIRECPISSPKLNEVIPVFAAMAKDRRFPSFVRTVEFFTNETDVQMNVTDTTRPLARHFFDWCATSLPGYAPGAIQYGGFRVGPRSFFQVNRHLIQQLTDSAIGDALGGTALDLYAGVGLFSLPLASRFSEVTAIESGSSAIADIKHNAEQHGARVNAVRSTVDEFLPTLQTSPDFVLADPPREGLGKYAVNELLRLKPRRLHIVACDPATLARDLQALTANGYGIDRMLLIDLFPQTYHLETVTHLSLA